MKPYFERDGITLYHGDALETLRALPDGAAQMCVTSPPYWGLRDYGTAQWDGGDAECDHLGKPFRTKAHLNENWGAGYSDVKNGEGREPMGATCSKCGARRIDQQLGLESTPELYVAHMVEVFREVRRVLRPDGTLWLNIGDSYAASGRNAGNSNGTAASKLNTRHGEYSNIGRVERGSTLPAGLNERVRLAGGIGRAWTPAPAGYKPKDLVGIPWMLAFALRADGWYLRSDIIWAKPNPMPESVTDRPTKAHEYLFLMAKRATYYYDADAIREAAEWARWGDQTIGKEYRGINPVDMDTLDEKRATGRNKRTVWTIATEPYPEAHFATFPTALVTPCVLAGCPEGGTVLEPFAGSGTTLQVAKQLGRKAIGIELNADYLPLIEDRLNRIPIPMPLFTVPAERPQQLTWEALPS